jgi:hypothetical protein
LFLFFVSCFILLPSPPQCTHYSFSIVSKKSAHNSMTAISRQPFAIGSLLCLPHYSLFFSSLSKWFFHLGRSLPRAVSRGARRAGGVVRALFVSPFVFEKRMPAFLAPLFRAASRRAGRAGTFPNIGEN